MAKIFVSYRRADNAAGYAMTLSTELRQAFGNRHVFRDMRSIPPGVDFGDHIRKALDNCAVMLVLIGRHWATETTAEGRPRLFEPNDWVRQEVASALAAPRVLVIPVLVGNATLPRAEQLPPDLLPLLQRNAVSLEDRKWESDVASLISDLEEVPGLRSWWERFRWNSSGKTAGTKSRLGRRLAAGTAAGIGVLALIGIAVEEVDPDATQPSAVERIEPASGTATPHLDTAAANVDQRPATNSQPAAVSKGGQQDRVSASSVAYGDHVDISGLWMDGEGNRYQFNQFDDEIDIVQVTGPGAAMGGSGDGIIEGRTFGFDFYLQGAHSSSGTLALSPDARSMQGQMRDSFTGTVMPVYLQRL